MLATRDTRWLSRHVAQQPANLSGDYNEIMVFHNPHRKAALYTFSLFQTTTEIYFSSNTPQTNSNTPQTSSNTPQTNSNTPQTNSNTPQTSSNTPQTSSNTPQQHSSDQKDTSDVSASVT
ncbi:hypothetical protein C0Q70_06501 [Pomacea canaliculata]|uniref:Uncharacterized protein n=1 Tax=Pomacea canaliculata TaxID=400727 RepID=A0A2T7PP92_POMCA|nr:hypothetical protein C0Q70_06501 [Pomacea canaliculata]